MLIDGEGMQPMATLAPVEETHQPLEHLLRGFTDHDAPEKSIINACVHCGLCLSSCPTYVETGHEASSPRGRIYLIKMVSEGNLDIEDEVFTGQMSQCLNCRACEAVCPSGVQYGRLVEAARDQIQQVEERPQPPPCKVTRGAVFGLLFPHMPLFRAFSWMLRLYQRAACRRSCARERHPQTAETEGAGTAAAEDGRQVLHPARQRPARPRTARRSTPSASSPAASSPPRSRMCARDGTRARGERQRCLRLRRAGMLRRACTPTRAISTARVRWRARTLTPSSGVARRR